MGDIEKFRNASLKLVRDREKATVEESKNREIGLEIRQELMLGMIRHLVAENKNCEIEMIRNPRLNRITLNVSYDEGILTNDPEVSDTVTKVKEVESLMSIKAVDSVIKYNK